VIKDKKEKVGDAEVKLQELRHEIQGLGKEKTAAANHIIGLEKQYEWIVEEKEYVSFSNVECSCPFMILFRQFGKPGSQYDFSKTNVAELRERVKTLEESQKGMKKKVNPKVINMIDR
jgi:structural maintenance of chromosome 2